ncbi:MAG TPA: ABC transporter substrate-binding protein [Acetobacteraceae bacterium]|nr:ABC transporter substrate-binding protein [Acetobacteraceae bacterium]
MVSILRRVLVCTLLLAATGARAEEIVVSNYGSGSPPFPWSVALEKQFFQQEGVDITGIISSEGGGTTVRNMVAGGVIFGEMNPAAFIAAVQQGARLRLVADTVPLIAGMVWAVKADSSIKTLADIKGHKLGYTNPKSTSQGLTAGLLAYAKLSMSDVETVKTGGFGEGVAALDLGLIDVAPVPDLIWIRSGAKLRVIATAEEVLPALSNVLCVATVDATETQGDKIRAIIRARRRAVQFMNEHPDEAADIIARVNRIDQEATRALLRKLLAVRVDGRPYYNEGRIYFDGINRMLKMQESIGNVQPPYDVEKVTDTRFLPDDLKEPVR